MLLFFVIVIPGGMDHQKVCRSGATILCLLLALSIKGCVGKVDIIQGPVFVHEPPDHVDFSNATGVGVTCAARGVPQPSVRWLHSSGAPVTDVKNLRHALDNGTLYFPPFSAEGYRQDIHSSGYRCLASNTLGTIISKEIHLRAVVKQFYEVHVYDEFVIRGNTAVLRCYIPSFVRDYVIVTSWTAEGGAIPQQTVIANGDKYSIFPSGELHIREVANKDSLHYRCRTKHRLTAESRASNSVGRLIVTDTKSSVPPRMTHSRASVFVQQGETTHLPCAAQGYPVPTYSWYRAKEMQHLSLVSIGGRIHLLGGTLQLRNVQVGDSGAYHCVVNNSVGTERTETILTVTAPLSVEIEPQHQIVDVGKPSSFRCKVNGHPTPHITWWKDGKPLVPERRVMLTPREVLRLDSVQREDRGMYQCFAQNSHAAVQATAELKLGDAAPQLLYSFADQTVRPGASVSLKCVASGNPPPQVRWTLDEHLITSNERFLLEEHISQHSDVISFVNISKVRPEDGGEFQCVASNKVGQTAHVGKINVFGPPYIRPFRNVTAVAGSVMVVRCHVTGYPIQSVSWEREGIILPINHRQKVFANGTLVVLNVQRASDEGTYTCHARDEQGRSAKAVVHVAVLNPPKISPFSFPVDIQQGMRGIVTCSVIHGDLPIAVTWLQDGRPIQLNSDISVKNVEDLTSTLVVHSITPRHNGNYTCVATNGAATVTHTAQLLVLVPSRWVAEPRDESVVSGHPMTLQCQADGSPAPTITWRKAVGRLPGEYTSLERASGRYEAHPNGSLTVRVSSKADEGYYLCQASNGVGPELSKVVYLKVHVPAYFEAKSRKQMAKRGSNAVLVCDALGDLPMTITWRPRNQRLEAPARSRFSTKEHATSLGYVSELIINKVERGDSAEFTCLANNAFGRDETRIHLVIQEAPEAPRGVKVLSHGSRSAHLSWSAPYDGNSAIGRFVIVFRAADVSWKSNQRNVSVSGEDTSATVDALRPATRYELRIAAQNDVGMGEVSEPVWFTTDDEAPEGPPQNITVEAVDSQTIRIQWKPPKRELWNGDILGYHIGYRQLDSGDQFMFKALDAGTEARGQYLLSDLKKFAKYAIVVQAYNRVGTGPRSDEYTTTTAEDVPSQPPRDVTCVPSSSQGVQVTWKPPSVHALHGVLRGYKVFYKPIDERGMSNGRRKTESKTVTIQKTELSGLHKFTNYSIHVAAFTSAGDGLRSSATFCRTEEDVPGPPAEMKVLVMSSDAIIVSWRPPAFPNGVITKYTAYTQPLQTPAKMPLVHHLPPTQFYHEARGLTENQHYEFWVTASTSVGEGEKTHVVSKSAISTVPARIASFPELVLANRKSDIKLPCRAVGIPTPDKEWLAKGLAIQENSRLHVLSDGSLLIMNVRSADAGNYSCKVQNIYASDEITHEVVIQVSQEDDYPPAPPTMSATQKTTNSVIVSWKIAEEGLSPIRGFTLNYKKEYGEWEEVTLLPEMETHRLEGLACGTRYQMYMTAFNAIGNSEPGDMVSVTTRGAVPEVPDKVHIVRVNTSFILLHPQVWPDGGCPLHSLMVEYKGRYDRDWTMAAQTVDPTRDVLVSGLHPATPYSLKLSARNDAGITVVEYDVFTLGAKGEMMDSALGGLSSVPFYKDPNVLVPIIAIFITVLTIMMGACVFVKCRRGAVYKYRTKSLRTSLVRKSSSSRIGESKPPLHGEGGGGGGGGEVMQNRLSQMITEIPDGAELETKEIQSEMPDDNSKLGGVQQQQQDDICPYATFQLPGYRYDASPNVRFHTFGYSASLNKEDPNSVSMSQYSKVRKKSSPHNVRCPVSDTTLCRSSSPEHLKSSTLRKEVMPRLYPSVVIPTAPPAAEFESATTDSDDTPDIAPSSRPRLRSLQQHVPDILDHRPDSSTSNETSSDEDNRPLSHRHNKARSRLLNKRQVCMSTVAADRDTSPESNTEETTFSYRGGDNSIGQQQQQPAICYSDPSAKSRQQQRGSEVDQSTQLKNEKNVRSPTGLAAVEEELIALLKRGEPPPGNPPRTDNKNKIDCQIRV